MLRACCPHTAAMDVCLHGWAATHCLLPTACMAVHYPHAVLTRGLCMAIALPDSSGEQRVGCICMYEVVCVRPWSGRPAVH